MNEKRPNYTETEVPPGELLSDVCTWTRGLLEDPYSIDLNQSLSSLRGILRIRDTTPAVGVLLSVLIAQGTVVSGLVLQEKTISILNWLGDQHTLVEGASVTKSLITLARRALPDSLALYSFRGTQVAHSVYATGKESSYILLPRQKTGMLLRFEWDPLPETVLDGLDDDRRLVLDIASHFRIGADDQLHRLLTPTQMVLLHALILEKGGVNLERMRDLYLTAFKYKDAASSEDIDSIILQQLAMLRKNINMHLARFLSNEQKQAGTFCEIRKEVHGNAKSPYQLRLRTFDASSDSRPLRPNQTRELYLSKESIFFNVLPEFQQKLRLICTSVGYSPSGRVIPLISDARFKLFLQLLNLPPGMTVPDSQLWEAYDRKPDTEPDTRKSQILNVVIRELNLLLAKSFGEGNMVIKAKKGRGEPSHRYLLINPDLLQPKKD